MQRMNNDLISRSALKKKIEEVQYTQEFCIEHQIDYSVSMQMLGMVIDNAPTVERKPFATVTFDKDELDRIVDERVIEPIKNGELVIKEKRPTGHWIEHYDNSDGFTWLTCSRCMCKAYEDDYNFCPNCGADMRGEENE